MKKFVSLALSGVLLFSVLGFSACTNEEPEVPDTQVSEQQNADVDYSGLINFKEAVANLPVKTAINNYSSNIGYLDELLLKGKAMQEKLKEEKIKNADGLDEFEAAYEQLEDLWDTAEKAAGKYVKGFYKTVGKKDVTAVYCYMNVNYTAEKGNTYIFALTYTENDTPVTVYMNATTTSDIVEVSVYEDTPEKFYAAENTNDMTNTPVYHNITLDLDAVLSAAR